MQNEHIKMLVCTATGNRGPLRSAALRISLRLAPTAVAAMLSESLELPQSPWACDPHHGFTTQATSSAFSMKSFFHSMSVSSSLVQKCRYFMPCLDFYPSICEAGTCYSHPALTLLSFFYSTEVLHPQISFQFHISFGKAQI